MSLKNFFDAKRIAVVGAAREEFKVGNVIFRNLLKNKSLKVFPINPNADKIEGVKCLPDVLSVPFPLDLVIICIPSILVPSILEQCGKKDVKNVIIVSAGFSESGNKVLEEKIREVSSKYKISVLGPNVLGLINPYKELNASFFSGNLEKGDVSFISQSGALGTAILDRAVQEKLGFSAFISLGNMLNTDFISALEYLEKEVYTEVIMIYIESLKENTGKDFLELCRRITGKKKIIVLKAGQTLAGENAAKTHTSSLSSDARIYSGVFKQAGIIEVKSLEEMFLLARIYSKNQNLGKKVCIVSNAGGLGVLATDSCIEAGLSIEKIPENILEEIDKIVPKGYSRSNPLDILGDALAERYEKVLKILDRQNWFDFFIVLLTPQAMTQPVETVQILTKLKKPVIACFVGGKSLEAAKLLLRDEKIINFDDVSKISILGKV